MNCVVSKGLQILQGSTLRGKILSRPGAGLREKVRTLRVMAGGHQTSTSTWHLPELQTYSQVR